MIKYLTTSLTLPLLFFFISTKAQDSVDALVESFMKEKEVPGLALVVAKRDSILKEEYYGLANLELDVPVTENSVFAIASMGKAYTAAAILLLAQQEKLSLHDPITDYLPEAPKSWQNISLYHLLNHSSGVPEDWALYSIEESNRFFRAVDANETFLDTLFKQELVFEPGTDILYSCGPFVLGVAIERISGLSYTDFMEENVFRPLGLTKTYVDHPYRLIPHRVSGYLLHDSTMVQTGHHGIGNGIVLAPAAYGRGDAGIRTTARDQLKFYQNLPELLTQESMEIMFNPATLNDGRIVSTSPGWMHWPVAGYPTYEHSGGFRTGFNTDIFVLPADEMVIIVLTNMYHSEPFSLAREIAFHYEPKYILLSKINASPDDEPDTTEEHLRFLKDLADTTGKANELAHKNFPRAYYSRGLTKVFSSTDSLTYLGTKDVTDQQLTLFDSLISTQRYYRLNGPQTRYTVFSLDKEGKVIFVDYPDPY